MASPMDAKTIEALPLELLKQIPAASPPEGVTPNFDNPPSLGPVIVGVGTTFLILACFCFFIRLYTNFAVTKKWNWSDLTLSLGFIFSIAYYAFVIIGSTRGSAGKHLWDLHLDKALDRGTLIQSYGATVTVTPALGLIKCSLFIQYFLLFNMLRYVRISCYIGGTASTVFYITVSIVAFVLNSPWPGESLLANILSWHYAKFAEFSIPTGVIGMVVDWGLLILPIPAVFGLNLSLGKKIGVMLVFMTGGLATIASTVGLYYRVKLQQENFDQQYKGGYIFIWTQVEMFAGIAAASMPAVKNFYKQHRTETPKWGSLQKSSFVQTIGGSGGNGTKQSEKRHDLEKYGALHSLQNLQTSRTMTNESKRTSHESKINGSDLDSAEWAGQRIPTAHMPV